VIAVHVLLLCSVFLSEAKEVRIRSDIVIKIVAEADLLRNTMTADET
jgi:hypothetical protein